MKRLSPGYLALGALCLLLWGASPSRGGEGRFRQLSQVTISFGEGEGEVGFRPGGPEAQAVGPQVVRSGVRGSFVILDTVKRRLIVVSGQGSVIRAIPLPQLVADVAAGPRGGLVVLDNDHRRVMDVTAQGQLRARWVVPPALKPLRGLAWGGEGPMVVNVHGHTATEEWAARRAEEPGAQTGLGRVLSRRLSDEEGALRLPHGSIRLGPEAGWRLGAVRFEGERQGVLYMLIESLSREVPLVVHRRLLALDGEGQRLGTMVLPDPEGYTPRRDLDVGHDGTVVIMTPQEGGITLTRFGLTEVAP